MITHCIRKIFLIAIVIGGLMTSSSFGAFIDTFETGINSTYWSITNSTPGLYSVGTSLDGVDFARIGASPTGLQYARLTLNLTAVTGASKITGDFSTSISFSNANLSGSSIDVAELQTHYSDGLGFDDSRSNQNGQEVHVWNGSLNGTTPVSTNFGTFTVTRVGSTVSGYFNGSLLYSMTETNPMDYLDFVLQNNSGNDPISVSFTDFSLSAQGVVPEPTSIVSLCIGVGLLTLAARFRTRRGVSQV